MTVHKNVLPVGAILAGGSAQRMRGLGKAQVRLGEDSLLQHVTRRFRPQVDRLLVSVHSVDDALALDDFEWVPDALKRRRGPLAGVYSALAKLLELPGQDWLLVVPVDAPFLPLDLGQRLVSAAQTQQKPVAVAVYQGAVQPVFSLWNTSTLSALKDALDTRGQPGLRHMLNDLAHAQVEWPVLTPPPFFNVNSEADLDAARLLVDAHVSEA